MERAPQLLRVPPRGLKRQRRFCIVPGQQALRVVRAETVRPPGDQPGRVGRTCSRLPAPCYGELSQRLIHEPRRALARRFPGELHAGRDGGVARDAGQAAQLVRAEAQHIVEAGIGAPEVERAVELGLAAQHAGGELVGEAAVALARSLTARRARR